MSFLEIAKFITTTIPFLALQWIGVIALRKTGLTGAWWCMLAGTLTVTLVIAFYLALNVWQGFGHEMLFQVYQIANYVHSFGTLLFAIGFAIHGCRTSRVRGRISELEMLNLAQATELERLRNR